MYGREELGRLPLVNQPGPNAGFQRKQVVDRTGTAAWKPRFLPQWINETLRPSRGLSDAPRDSQARDNLADAGAWIGDKRRIREGGARLSTFSTGPVSSTPILFLILKDRKKGRRAEQGSRGLEPLGVRRFKPLS